MGLHKDQVRGLRAEQYEQDRQLRAHTGALQKRIEAGYGLFVEAGYGGIGQEAPIVLPDITSTPQIVPSDSVSVAEPRNVVQDIATDSLTIEKAGIWVFNITIALEHNGVNAGRSMQVELYDVTRSQSLGSVAVAIGRNQEGTNFSTSFLAEVVEASAGDAFAVRLFSIADTFTLVTLDGSIFDVFQISETKVPPDIPAITVTLDPNKLGVNATLSPNLLEHSDAGSWQNARSTVSKSSGKWCWEVQATEDYGQGQAQVMAGIANDNKLYEGYMGQPNDGNSYSVSNDQNGNKYPGNDPTSAAWTQQDDWIMMCFDADAGTLGFSQGGGTITPLFSGISAGDWYCGCSNETTTAICNFGATPMTYQIPAGYTSLDGSQSG